MGKNQLIKKYFYILDISEINQIKIIKYILTN